MQSQQGPTAQFTLQGFFSIKLNFNSPWYLIPGINVAPFSILSMKFMKGVRSFTLMGMKKWREHYSPWSDLIYFVDHSFYFKGHWTNVMSTKYILWEQISDFMITSRYGNLKRRIIKWSSSLPMILSFDKYPLSACLLQAHTILRSTGIKIQPSGTEDMRILGCPVTGNSLFIPQIFTEYHIKGNQINMIWETIPMG